MNPEFWRKKRVLLTGHTGFKGSWLALWLESLGAELLGYSLPPPTEPSLFVLAQVARGLTSIQGDILDWEHVRSVVREYQPEVVFHLAAQSLVRRSYADPVGTYATNVMGTVHLLEAVRETPSVRGMVVVTSDKCYENREDQKAYRETDRLGGNDPYSSSKASAELVTAAYRSSFFLSAEQTPPTGIASARAGNVIGGGDWAADRLIPDVMRAVLQGQEVRIRNPRAVRPWQHVLDPLRGYLLLAEKLCQSPARFSEAWNFGPGQADALPVSDILDRLRQQWGPGLSWGAQDGVHPHEASYLKLDCTKAKEQLGWEPRWNLDCSLRATLQWYQGYQARQDMRAITQEQIRSYQEQANLPEISRR